MAAATSTHNSSFRLSEDWLATIIGLLIVLIIGSGLLGPGAQNVSVSAGAGETASAVLRPLSNWRVSATLDGESTGATTLPTALTDGQTVVITCDNGALTVESADTLPEGVNSPPEGRAQVVVVNQCDAAVSLTYRTNQTIPWPIFNLFNR